jgi:RimJ/RimL family protein N-acetyltransferase
MPFEPQHLTDLKLQSAQVASEGNFDNPAYAASLKSSGPAYTAFFDGKVVAVAGMVNIWNGRGLAWALFTPMALDHFTEIYKAIKRFLEISDVRRIECFVDCEFERAHRMARKLGFVMECERMESFTPDGRACSLYARIRHG